jgi:hypothetical protein
LNLGWGTAKSKYISNFENKNVPRKRKTLVAKEEKYR